MLHTESLKQEIIQEVFIKIWLNRDRLNEVENLGAWLRKITINECLLYLRKASVYESKLTGLNQESVSMNHSLQNLSVKEIQETVQRAVASMPSQRRAIYVLSRERGMTTKQIAEQMGLSNGYVRNVLSSALQTIREHLSVSIDLSVVFLLLIMR